MKTMDGVDSVATHFVAYGVAETPAEYVLARPTVYLDTTIPSYLAARPSSNPQRARRQHITQEWWDLYRWQFDVCISEHVYKEAEAGDAIAARDRLDILDAFRRVEEKSGADELAGKLMKECGLPPKANTDARHVALAAMHSLKFLLTWNYKHLANNVLRPKMMHICRREGYTCPRIVTPEEIMRLRTHEELHR
jgi:hypothetical protein